MAKLLKDPYPFPEMDLKKPFQETFKAQEDALAAIPEDKIYSYGVADGQALYYIVSLNPPVLQWIPFLDEWQLPAAHIRGLRTQDLEAHIKMNADWKALTEKRKDGE